MMIYLFSSSPKTVESTLQSLRMPFVLVTKENFAKFVATMPEFGKDDLGISYDFGKIYPDSLLAKLPIINIHFSLLPKYRGAVPVEAAVLNGETKTGITIQWTDKLMDAGDIIMVKEVEISKTQTSGELQRYMDSLLPDMLTRLFAEKDFSKWKTEKQSGEANYCYKQILNRNEAKLDFTHFTATEVIRRVKAFNPEPYAWCDITFQGKKMTMNIVNAQVYEYANQPLKRILPNSLEWVKKRGLVIGTLLGSVLVTEMVISGKKRLSNGDIVSLKDKLFIQ